MVAAIIFRLVPFPISSRKHLPVLVASMLLSVGALSGLASLGLASFFGTESASPKIGIKVADELWVCPHHPQGCPKDCLCPKTRIHVEAKHGGGDVGWLREKAWVTCSEHESGMNAPSFSVFISETVLTPVFLFVFNSWEGNRFLKLPHSDPNRPAKIPIV